MADLLSFSLSDHAARDYAIVCLGFASTQLPLLSIELFWGKSYFNHYWASHFNLHGSFHHYFLKTLQISLKIIMVGKTDFQNKTAKVAITQVLAHWVSFYKLWAMALSRPYLNAKYGQHWSSHQYGGERNMVIICDRMSTCERHLFNRNPS